STRCSIGSRSASPRCPGTRSPRSATIPGRSARMRSRIVGTGRYLPSRILGNDELAERIDTSDEWIRTRTGIRQRHMAAENEQTSDLALRAAQEALRAASLAPGDLDLIVVATTTPDVVFPSTACILQAKLGARGGAAFDVQAVCSGFAYAVASAEGVGPSDLRAEN